MTETRGLEESLDWMASLVNLVLRVKKEHLGQEDLEERVDQLV